MKQVKDMTKDELLEVCLMQWKTLERQKEVLDTFEKTLAELKKQLEINQNIEDQMKLILAVDGLPARAKKLLKQISPISIRR